MNQIIKYFHQPYPCPVRRKETLLITSLLVFSVLFIFQPFGLDHIAAERKFRVISGYGVVTAAVLFLTLYVLPWLLPRFYDENRWTVGRNIFNTAVTLVLVALGNIVYGSVFGITWQHFNVSVLLSALVMTVATGTLPVILITMLRQNRLLAVSLREAREINNSLAACNGHPQQQETNRMLTLSGTGKDDMMELPSDRLLYMEACGNYVKVHYIKDSAVAQRTLRATH